MPRAAYGAFCAAWDKAVEGRVGRESLLGSMPMRNVNQVLSTPDSAPDPVKVAKEGEARHLIMEMLSSGFRCTLSLLVGGCLQLGVVYLVASPILLPQSTQTS